MNELVLKSGPSLIARHWQAKTATEAGCWVEKDITAQAHERLFEHVELADDVTLGDLFSLMEASPVLKAVYVRDFAESLCAEVAKGPLASSDENPEDALDSLELYQRWSLDTGTSTYEAMNRLNFHGIGIPQSADRPDMGVAKGERIQWGVSMVNPRKMLHLPVRVNAEVIVCEDDVDAKGYGRELATVRNPFVTLGQILHGVLWELSFYGAPSEAEEVTVALKTQMAEFHTGDVESELHDDFFESLSREDDLAGARLLFDSIGAFTPHAISNALRELEDTANAGEGLLATLGDTVVLKAEYLELPARAVRKAFRLARSS